MTSPHIIPENNEDSLLTGIHPAYTLSATNGLSEVNELMIKNFLQTLAEVSLAIASKKLEGKES